MHTWTMKQCDKATEMANKTIDRLYHCCDDNGLDSCELDDLKDCMKILKRAEENREEIRELSDLIQSHQAC